MKKRGKSGADRFEETVSRSEFLRAFGTLAVYAAPAVLLASQVGCDDTTGGGGSDDNCSFSSSSFSSVSCSSESASSSSEACVPGIDCAVPT